MVRIPVTLSSGKSIVFYSCETGECYLKSVLLGLPPFPKQVVTRNVHILSGYLDSDIIHKEDSTNRKTYFARRNQRSCMSFSERTDKQIVQWDNSFKMSSQSKLLYCILGNRIKIKILCNWRRKYRLLTISVQHVLRREVRLWITNYNHLYFSYLDLKISNR